MRVVFTRAAAADLEDIADHIAQDNPGRALTFVRELRVACRQIRDSPRAFPVVPDHKDAGLRRRAYGRYLIFYRIQDDAVVIVHILHGARDLEAVVF